MCSQPAIEVVNLSKSFRIGSLRDAQPNFTESLIEMASAPFRRVRSLMRSHLPDAADEILWALREVSFSVEQGEVLGIIGRNGAGKSTLLKILTGISAPTSGYARIHGRVGSLLEVGTGFHPELTGRENVFMNGTILGMKNREIKQRFDEIVAFSGVEKFIDTPIKRYSSGMQVRLAFSVAAHLDPEVLLVDEVLSVGDAEFRRKCMGKMREVTGQGRTVVLVSHSMPSIQHLSDRVILLERGQIVADGQPGEIIARYLKSDATALTLAETTLTQHPRRKPGCAPLLTSIRLLNRHHTPTSVFSVGDPLTIEVGVDTHGQLYRSCRLVINLFDAYEQRICKFTSELQMNHELILHGRQSFTCVWEECLLAPGSYTIGLVLQSDTHQERVIDKIDQVLSFDMVAGDVFGTGHALSEGIALIWARAHWEIQSHNHQPSNQ